MSYCQRSAARFVIRYYAGPMRNVLACVALCTILSSLKSQTMIACHGSHRNLSERERFPFEQPCFKRLDEQIGWYLGTKTPHYRSRKNFTRMNGDHGQ